MIFFARLILVCFVSDQAIQFQAPHQEGKRDQTRFLKAITWHSGQDNLLIFTHKKLRFFSSEEQKKEEG